MLHTHTQQPTNTLVDRTFLHDKKNISTTTTYGTAVPYRSNACFRGQGIRDDSRNTTTSSTLVVVVLANDNRSQQQQHHANVLVRVVARRVRVCCLLVRFLIVISTNVPSQ